MKSSRKRFIFFIVWFIFCLYSFTRKDLNLTFYNPFPYSKFWEQIRKFFMNLGYFQRPLATMIFIILGFILIGLYLKLIRSRLPSGNLTWIKQMLPFIILGIISYPMFSHDIFNYIFNAKMVLFYRVNPYLGTASWFLSDPWTRFMHNVHTPAPYAYGWTLISLLPGLITLTQKFVLSFWGMKIFVAIFWIGQLIILKQLVKNLFPNQPWRWWLFVLNPLVLMETLIIGHNDVVMMFPALISLWFLLKGKHLFNRYWLLAVVFLFASVSIKYATVVLLPFYFFPYFSGSFLKTKKVDLANLFSVALFLVMFTRPGQLHSWYLIWAFSLAVLSRRRLIISFFTCLTIGAFFCYAPYIYYGNWDPPVYLIRSLIWGLSLIFIPLVVKLINPDSIKQVKRTNRQ